MYQLSGGTHMEMNSDDFLKLQIFAIRILSLKYNSSSCESNWSTFGIVRPNDFGILSPNREFSIKIGTTLSTQKKEKIV